MSRKSDIERISKEVKVKVKIDVDGSGESNIETGVPFLDHMLDTLAVHSLFDLEIKAEGDIKVDEHHTTEEVGIALGEAIKVAAGEDVVRFADAIVPMDEALSSVAIDISGRAFYKFEGNVPEHFYKNIVNVFLLGLAQGGGITIHAHVLYGWNSHHISESLFKALALCLNRATRKRKVGKIPSAKGYI